MQVLFDSTLQIILPHRMPLRWTQRYFRVSEEPITKWGLTPDNHNTIDDIVGNCALFTHHTLLNGEQAYLYDNFIGGWVNQLTYLPEKGGCSAHDPTRKL